MSKSVSGVQIVGPVQSRAQDEILTPAANSFVAILHRSFNARCAHAARFPRHASVGEQGSSSVPPLHSAQLQLTPATSKLSCTFYAP